MKEKELKDYNELCRKRNEMREKIYKKSCRGRSYSKIWYWFTRIVLPIFIFFYLYEDITNRNGMRYNYSVSTPEIVWRWELKRVRTPLEESLKCVSPCTQ